MDLIILVEKKCLKGNEISHIFVGGGYNCLWRYLIFGGKWTLPKVPLLELDLRQLFAENSDRDSCLASNFRPEVVRIRQ